MNRDKAWLKEELLRDLMRFNGNPNMTDYELGIASGIRTAINLTEKLDEPEVEEKFYTFDNAKEWLEDNGFVVFEKDKLDEEVQRMIDKTYKEMNEKPVLPQFVADWIDTHNLHGNNPLREYRDLEIDFNEGWTDEKDAAVYHWVNKNPYAFIDALRYGYDAEKEKLYTVDLPHSYELIKLLHTQTYHIKKYNESGFGDYTNTFTEAEIKKIDERLMVFAEEVKPCN